MSVTDEAGAFVGVRLFVGLLSMLAVARTMGEKCYLEATRVTDLHSGARKCEVCYCLSLMHLCISYSTAGCSDTHGHVALKHSTFWQAECRLPQHKVH